MRYGELRGRPEDFDAFLEPCATPQVRVPQRINFEPEEVEHGLVKLVLSLVELVRQLLEKQALRRIEGGGLSAGQVERLGVTLLRLEQQMTALKTHFQIDSLDLDLGPLGHLLAEESHEASPET